MIIRGHFIADAPYFAVYLQSQWFEGPVWLLADTGAARTTLLDRDMSNLKVPLEALEPAEISIVGIGGSVRSFVLRNVEIAFATSEGDFLLQQDIWVAQHDLDQLPPGSGNLQKNQNKDRDIDLDLPCPLPNNG